MLIARVGGEVFEDGEEIFAAKEMYAKNDTQGLKKMLFSTQD